MNFNEDLARQLSHDRSLRSARVPAGYPRPERSGLRRLQRKAARRRSAASLDLAH